MVDDVWNGDGGAGGCWGRVAAITAVKHTTIHWSTNQIAHKTSREEDCQSADGETGDGLLQTNNCK